MCIPDKWFQTGNAFTSEVNWESIGADTFLLSFIPNVIARTFGWSFGSSWFTFMSFSIKFSSFRTGNTVFLMKIKDGFFTSTINTLRIRSSQEWSLNGTLGNVIIGDESEQLFIVIIDGLITDDPVASVEVTDIFIIGLSLTNTPSLDSLLLSY